MAKKKDLRVEIVEALEDKPIIKHVCINCGKELGEVWTTKNIRRRCNSCGDYTGAIYEVR